MPLPSTGQLAFSQVNTELSRPSNQTINLNNSGVRSLAKKTASNSQIAFSNLRGKSASIVATGGTITNINIGGVTWRVHTFTSSGTFNVTDTGIDGTVEYLIIAGGGGAGGVTGMFGIVGDFPAQSGGGGAGGLLTNVGGGRLAISQTAYSIVVGAGGAGSGNGETNAGNGGSSSAFGISCVGGGRGGRAHSFGTSGGSGGFAADGASGGSGGGGALASGIRTNATALLRTANGGAGTSGQGFRGGNSTTSGTIGPGGGGGRGGAGGVNNDGAGQANSITGTSITYSVGGSTRKTNGNGANGTANRGNGGQGACLLKNNDTRRGGSGGSGIVVIRYPLL